MTNPTESNQRGMRIAAVVLGFLCLSLPFLAVVGADADLWWHVRTGIQILEEGQIPAVDAWSFTAAGDPWVNHEWVFDIVVALVYNAAGTTGLWALRAVLFLTLIGTLTALLARRLREPLLILLGLGLVIPIFGFFINVRAASFTYLFTVWSLLALDLVRDGKNGYLIAFPAIIAVWANIHGGFLMGLALIGTTMGCFLLGIDGIRERPGSKAIAAIIVAGLATLAATVLNPWGIGLYGYLFQEMGASHAHVTMWQPIQGAQLIFFYSFLLVPLALWVLSAILAPAPDSRLRGGPLRQFSLVFMLLLTAYTTWNAARFFVSMALFGTLLAADAFGILFRRIQEQSELELIEKLLQPRWTLLLAGGGVAVVCVPFGLSMINQPRVYVEPVHYPIEAARWLADNPVGTNVAVPLHWGSYLIWHRPELRVSVDGRNTTIYDDNWMDDYLNAWSDGTAGQILEGHDVHFWMVDPDSPQHETLLGQGWHPAYRDEIAIVMVRESRPVVEGKQGDALRVFP